MNTTTCYSTVSGVGLTRQVPPQSLCSKVSSSAYLSRECSDKSSSEHYFFSIEHRNTAACCMAGVLTRSGG